MRTATLARDARLVMRDRQPGFREHYRLPSGDTVLCESPAQLNWWRQTSEAIHSNALDRNLLQIGELFEHSIANGREARISWNPIYGEGGGSDGASMQRVEESDPVGVAVFSKIMGQFAYSQVMAAYQREDYMFSAMIPVVQTPHQNGERVPGVSRLGDQSGIVAEGNEYPRAGVSQDWMDIPPTVKRGFIVEWTKELVYLNGVTQGVDVPIMQRLTDNAAELGYNRECRAIDAFIDENSTAHRYNRLSRGQIATYGDNSGNHDFDNLQASNALQDWTDIDNALQLLLAMLDPNTGQPIVPNLNNLSLVVTYGLLSTANYIAKMTGIEVNAGGYATSGTLFRTLTGNPLSVTFKPVASANLAMRMATDTSWFLGDVGRTVKCFQNWGITTTTRAGNSDPEFTRDVVGGTKVSVKDVFAVVEPRATVKCTA